MKKLTTEEKKRFQMNIKPLCIHIQGCSICEGPILTEQYYCYDKCDYDPGLPGKACRYCMEELTYPEYENYKKRADYARKHPTKPSYYNKGSYNKIKEERK